MSVMQTIMETIAQVLPDKEADPLIAHDRLCRQGACNASTGHAKVRGEARFTAEFKLDNLALCGAGAQHHRKRKNSQDRYRRGRSRRRACWPSSRTKTCRG